MVKGNIQVIEDDVVREVPIGNEGREVLYFLRSNSPYAAGEVAGVDPKAAKRLKDRKRRGGPIAEPYDPKKHGGEERGLEGAPADKQIRRGRGPGGAETKGA